MMQILLRGAIKLYEMVLFLVLGTWLSYFSVQCVTSPHSLPDHFTPPKLLGLHQKAPQDVSIAQKIARWFWTPDDEERRGDRKVKVSGAKYSNNKPQQVKQETGPKGSSTNLMAFWVAPSSQNKYSRFPAGRSEDNCNPCNKFPWVPVPRALPAVPAILSNHGDQFSLTIPAISLQYGAPTGGGSNGVPNPSYGVPLNQNKPVQTFNSDYGGTPPPPPSPLPVSPQSHYNPLGPKIQPSQTYGIPTGLEKIPLSQSHPTPLSYPPNIQYSAPSSHVPQKVKPLLVHTPIPFPSMSQGPLPPLFQYQQFTSDGDLNSYLQPPAPVANEDIIKGNECGKCRPSSLEQIPEDSVAAQAQHQETGTHIQAVTNNAAGIEVVKSVPLAEYLSSVEYPMQIVQAPLVDVADLPKYINFKIPEHKGPGFLQHSGHALFYNHGLKVEASSSSPPDNVLSASSLQNNFPDQQSNGPSPTTAPTTISISSTSEPLRSTLYSSSNPSTFFSTHSIPHTTTPKTLLYSTISELMPPLPDPPQTFYSEFNTSSLEQQSNTLIQAGIPSNIRFFNPPPLKVTSSPVNWSRPTPPQSLAYTTNQPRFPSQRPNIASTPSSKKTKQVHQIIVPYTTKHTKTVQANDPGWTPMPPQARRVPQQLENSHKQIINVTFTTGSDIHLGESLPLSSSGSEQFESVKLPSPDEGVTPELVSQLLNFEEANNQNSIRAVVHPGDVHHVLAANLRALLRGEEDNVDLQRLQKNIDNWTAEGYKTNAPPEHFHTLTTLSHLSPSKNIPEEYFTTPSTFLSNSNNDDNHNKGNVEGHYNGNHNDGSLANNYNKNTSTELGDYETSGSQNHPIRTTSHLHFKTQANVIPQDYESWSLLDTKLKYNTTAVSSNSVITPTIVVSTSTTDNTQSTTNLPPTTTSTITEPSSKAWEQLQVSISPLTKEKVYVVTPQPVLSESTTPIEITKDVPMSITSTRVDRSYSVETAKRTARFLHQSSSTQKENKVPEITSTIETATKSPGTRTANRILSSTSKTLKDSAENINPINDNGSFGIKLMPDTISNRLRRYQDNKGYFRFFPELLKASDYLEDGDIDQIRRVALELKREGPTSS